jgi:hypothetical protein
MVDYFQPLTAWLEEENKGRKIGWDDERARTTKKKSAKNASTTANARSRSAHSVLKQQLCGRPTAF